MNECFTLKEGSSYFVVRSLDDNRYYMRNMRSLGWPIKILECHSSDDEQMLVTVFSFKSGKRHMISFKFVDAQPI